MGRSLSERSSPSRPTHDLGWKANVQDTLEPSSGKQTTLNMLVFPTKASMDTSQIAEDIRNGTNTLMKVVPSLIKTLDEVAKVHPFIRGTQFLFAPLLRASQ